MANDGDKMETVTDFIFLSSKITVDGGCSHEIKRGLFLGRKAMTSLDSVLKSRDITLLTEVQTVRSFPDGSDAKKSACNVGNPGSISGSGTTPGEGSGNPLWYYYLENSMNRGAWWAAVQRVGCN